MQLPASAFVKGQKVYLSLPDYHQRHKAKAIVGYKWDPKVKCWVYPRSPEVAKALLEQFPDLVHEGDIEALAVLRDQAAEIKEMTTLSDYPTKMPPWLHQKQAYWFVMKIWGEADAVDLS